VDIVPDDCEYQILHPLETEAWDMGICEHDRQTGKTYRMVEMANYMVKAGYRVYYVTFNWAAVERLLKRGIHRDVTRMAISQVRQMDNMPPGFVLADDVMPEKMEREERSFQRHVVLAVWYTRS